MRLPSSLDLGNCCAAMIHSSLLKDVSFAAEQSCANTQQCELSTTITHTGDAVNRQMVLQGPPSGAPSPSPKASQQGEQRSALASPSTVATVGTVWPSSV